MRPNPRSAAPSGGWASATRRRSRSSSSATNLAAATQTSVPRRPAAPLAPVAPDWLPLTPRGPAGAGRPLAASVWLSEIPTPPDIGVRAPVVCLRPGALERLRKRPPSRFRPSGIVLGAQEIVTMDIPYRKYFFGPGNILGGRDRARRQTASATSASTPSAPPACGSSPSPGASGSSCRGSG